MPLVVLFSLLAVGCAHSASTYDVRAFGAAGDSQTLDTASFQKALDQCAGHGGGTVIVPAGKYLIGNIELKSNTTLRLERDATLLTSLNPDDYPIMNVRWEGKWRAGHRALIFADHASHIAILGPGKIEGSPKLGRLRDPRAPALIEPIDCDGVLLDGFSTHYEHMWNIHPTYCSNVIARNLHERSENGSQSDGIDVDSCNHVLIENCDIDTGDDCIALKSGRSASSIGVGTVTM